MLSRRSLALLAALAPAAACGDNRAAPPDPPAPDAPADAAPDADPLGSLPATGLCLDPACAQISPRAREYTPQFQLYSDGALKRRWLLLPSNAKIDTSDMSRWKFPVGTKAWKEFTRNGVRVETRFMQKLLDDDDAPGAWFYTAFVWNEAQTEALPVTSGLQNVLGTQHDVPSRAQCRACHEEVKPSRLLGVEAIQLDASPLLQALVDEQLVTDPPTGLRIPGTATDRAALGYLHVNCGSCHNPTSSVEDKTPLDLRLRPGYTTVADTPTYRTAVGVAAAIPYTEGSTTYSTIVVPGDPAASALLSRMSSRIPLRFMPNVGVEVTDRAGQSTLSAWIDAL